MAQAPQELEVDVSSEVALEEAPATEENLVAATTATAKPSAKKVRKGRTSRVAEAAAPPTAVPAPIPKKSATIASATESEKPKMGNVVEMFNAIKNFVDALWDVFPNKESVNPLLLYRRFLEEIKLSHVTAMNRVCDGFATFFKTVVSKTNKGADITVDDCLVSGQLSKITTGLKIIFSETIFIPIQRYIHLAKATDDDEVLASIHVHLLTISSMMAPSKAKFAKLERLGVKVSNEMAFIRDMMGTIEKSTRGMAKEEDPKAAMLSLVTSGKLMSIIGQMESKVKSNNLDIGKLFTAMSGYAQSEDSPEDEEESAENEGETST